MRLRLVLTAAQTGWHLLHARLRRLIACDRQRPRQICSDSHAPLMHDFGPPYRLFARAGQGLVVLCAGFLLTEGICFAADAGSGPTPGVPVADFAAETLLRTIVQQISGGRIISPADDNAMQTWQRVLQRDIATERSPEVLRALEDFETYARARAADEKSAGRALIAAELTVFADQAGRMTGHAPPVESPVTVASPAGQSGGIAPAGVADGSVTDAGVTNAGVTNGSTLQADSVAAANATGDRSPDSPAGVAAEAVVAAASDTATAAANAASGEISPARSEGVAERAIRTAPPAPSANGIASVTDAVIHIASHTQQFGTTSVASDATGTDERPTGPTTDAAGSAVAHLIAADTSAAGPPQAAPNAAATVRANGETSQVPATGVTETPTAHVAIDSVMAVAQLNPGAVNNPPAANGPATAPSAASDPATAAFYAARGDAMLAHKDISTARKFYEFAANAGSARAAAALARTYDPAFAAQLGQVGLRPDPEMAASWYQRAEQLGARPAQLSQSGGTGK